MAYSLTLEDTLDHLTSQGLGKARELGHRMEPLSRHPTLPQLHVSHCERCLRTLAVRVDFDLPARGEISGLAFRERCPDYLINPAPLLEEQIE